MSTEVFFKTEEELLIFGCSCLLGVFFGAVYNVLRVVRAFFKHNKIIIFIEDFLYMLFVGLCFFVFSMELVRGQLRFFVVFGNVVGFMMFHYTAGNVVVFFARRISSFIKNWIFLPVFKVFVEPLLRCFSKIFTKTKRVFVQKSKRLKKIEKSRKNLLKVDGD